MNSNLLSDASKINGNEHNFMTLKRISEEVLEEDFNFKSRGKFR
jgi:hypothetical protein